MSSMQHQLAIDLQNHIEKAGGSTSHATCQEWIEKRFQTLVWTDAQIKHMVDRFLGWRLPENFNPDAGISFKRTFNEHTAHPMKHEPIGTNLFDAEQATAMVRYMIEGLP